ncbi:endonuclease VII domain-containing protein [Streptomyces boncukensis]
MRDGLQAYCRECWSAYHQQRQLARGRNVRPRVKTPEGHKYCRCCEQTKPHSEWHRNASASDGLATLCKACKALKGRAGHLKRQYGMTETDRQALVDSQFGICPICLRPDPVHVDHDHQTGRVRGVLCFTCNAAIGHLRDDPGVMRRAIGYVEGNSWKPKQAAPGVYLLPS